MSLRTRDIFSSLTMSNSSSLLLEYGVVSEQIGRLWRQNFGSQKSLSSHLQVVPLLLCFPFGCSMLSQEGAYTNRGVVGVLRG
jgi:hypothetical protein